jgi:hypothetical protein
MIDSSVPVQILLQHGENKTVCFAKIVSVEGDNVIVCPFLPNREMQPFRPERITLDAQHLEYVLNIAGASAMYLHHGYVNVP